jgi:uncharacterized repeat protein (TIGR01451 family)
VGRKWCVRARGALLVSAGLALLACPAAAWAESPPTIAKTFSPGSVRVGDEFEVTFTIANPNATPLSGVGFTDALPAGLVVSDTSIVSDDCSPPGGSTAAVPGSSSISLANAALAGSASCVIRVALVATSTGTKDNTTDPVTSNESGPGSPSNTASVVVTPARPSFSKFFASGAATVGNSVGLSFTLSNRVGNGPLTGLAFTDVLPGGLEVANPNALSSDCGGTVTAAPASTSIDLTGGTLADGATCSISVDVKATAIGDMHNVSSTLTSNEAPAGAASTAVLSVVEPPTFTKDFTATAIAVGQTTALSFTIANPAGNPALSNLGFSDALPSGLEVASPNGLSGDCGGGDIRGDPGATTIELLAAELNPGASCTFSLDVKGTSGGAKSNTTSPLTFSFASSGDPVSGNAGTASDSLNVIAPPAATKAFGAASIRPGGTTSLTFKIDNPNASTALTGVAFTDNLPAGLVVASPSGLSGACGAGSIGAAAGSGTVSLTGGSIAAGGSCSFSIDVTATTAGRKDNSTSPIASNEGGSGAAATATLFVGSAPTISKQFGAALIGVGGSTTLSFTLGNPNSDFALTGVGFADSLPSGLVVSALSGATSSCGGTLSASGSSITLSGAAIPAAGACTATVNVTGTTPGRKDNTSGAVTSTEGGNGNAASASIVVAAPPSVTITTPRDGARYAKGTSVKASYACQEGASGTGLRSCTGTVASGAAISTKTVGSKTFTVTATSTDGLTTTRTITYRVVEASSKFSISNLKAGADGTVTFDAKLPGAGKLSVLETAPKSAAARATALRPGRGMFTFGSKSVSATKAGTLKVKVDPTRAGKKLAKDRRDAFRVNVYVTYRPTGGGARTISRKVTIPR